MFCFYYRGHKTGIRNIEIRNTTIVRGRPTRMKSTNRYLPGPYTRTDAGSRGVINEHDAAIVIVMANVLGFTPRFCAE